MVVRISKRSKPEETRKALEKLARSRKKKKTGVAAFYGKLKGAYGDPLAYQKKVRDEWA
ncbi:MAG: hypothetical protein MUE95_09500 [Cyclobacteriaceae bacterium]|jgi:hypothetical protein|nr:hypothetical protein [Cyclobacteriaceae bacterium]